MLGWPGYTNTAGKLFGSVIDPLVDNPPTDVAVVRYTRDGDSVKHLKAVLAPVAGGPNSRRAVRLAVQLAQNAPSGPAKVTLMHVIPPGADEALRISAHKVFDYTLEGIEYDRIERRLIEADNVVDGILSQVEGHNMIVIGATEEPLFKNLLMGNITEQIAKRSQVTTIMVKRRSSRLHSIVRQTVLMPTTVETTPSS